MFRNSLRCSSGASKSSFGRIVKLMIILTVACFAFCAACTVTPNALQDAALPANVQSIQASSDQRQPDKKPFVFSVPKPAPELEGTRKIFYGFMPIYECSMPRPGEYDYYKIASVVSDDKYDGMLFAVTIEYTPFVSLKRQLYSYSPVCSRFLEEYEQWKKDNKLNGYEKPYPNAYNITYDMDDEFMEQFRAVWRERNSASDWEELCRGEEKIQSIRRDPELREQYVETLRRRELQRLQKLGYRYAYSGNYTKPCFFLTREQLENFPAVDEEDSYRFNWGWHWKFATEEQLLMDGEYVHTPLKRDVQWH